VAVLVGMFLFPLLAFGLSSPNFPRRGHHVQNVVSSLPAASNSSTYFFNHAVVDHFSGVTGATHWSQRYYIDERYWCGQGCPVLLYIGGEGPQGPPSDHLFMSTLAKKYGALQVALEHRFYGESYPVADMSVANLRYLSSNQALADLATFIEYISGYTPDRNDQSSSPPLKLKASARRSKWVSFGGSYPGALSGWLKLKYPQAVAGAISSSGPYFAEDNFEQYAEVVGTALSNPAIGGSAACYAAVQQATSALHELVVGTKPFGTNPAIPAALRPCNASLARSIGTSSNLDLATFEASVFSNFQGTVQYNNEVPSVATVAELCSDMTNVSLGATPIDRLAYVQREQYFQQCTPSSFVSDQVQSLLNTSFDGYGCNLTCSSGRQWIWQSCNEFGYFQTTTGPSSSNPFSAFTANTIDVAGRALCEAAFGLEAPPATQETNTFYGARELLAANVTMVNGAMDPWHALSVVDKADPYFQSCVGEQGEAVTPGGLACPAQRVLSSATVITIPTTAHCGDMYAPNNFAQFPYCPGPSCHNDTAALVEAHAKISADVARYLGIAATPVEAATEVLARRVAGVEDP